MRFLYSLILNIINDNVDGIYRKYRTDGLYAGLINSMYAEVRAGITKLLDDIPGNFIGNVHVLGCYDDKHLRTSVRYPVENPTIIIDNHKNKGYNLNDSKFNMFFLKRIS